mmetsp:Transcript_30800/g.64336  ORF Transcript_30800/g.64336 Transcript_30800/m.64336 type:complete len:115 (-) Transcript_30800:235-579(-)
MVHWLGGSLRHHQLEMILSMINILKFCDILLSSNNSSSSSSSLAKVNLPGTTISSTLSLPLCQTLSNFPLGCQMGVCFRRKLLAETIRSIRFSNLVFEFRLFEMCKREFTLCVK